MKEIVPGAKKRPQEAHAVLDVETKNLVVSREEIKRVTLKHVMKTFKRVAPHEDIELTLTMRLMIKIMMQKRWRLQMMTLMNL